jgi:hypothetical protein
MFNRAPHKPKDIDFDAEARALWERLNLDPKTKSGSDHWNPVDPIFRHPNGGGVIYVGNQTAASDIQMLRFVYARNTKEFINDLYILFRKLGITHVVNCTHGDGKSNKICVIFLFFSL